MSSFSPTAEGFRLIFRRPAIPLAEIAWRWSLGIAVWFVGGMFLVQYADSLPVSGIDRLLLGTRQPALALRALERIFHGSGLRFTEGGILLALGMTIAWIVLASLGRAATLRAMMQEFAITPAQRFSMRTTASLAGLNFLRAALALAALVATLGSALLANELWAASNLPVANAARLWFLLLIAVWIAWAILNWVTSAASLFVLVNSAPALDAVSQAVGWYRERTRAVTSVGIWFGLVRLGMLIISYAAGFTVLGMVSILGHGATLLLLILIFLAYCACADFLRTGRLAAYTRILGGEEAPIVGAGLDKPGGNPATGSFSIDQSELILSDVPLPAT